MWTVYLWCQSEKICIVKHPLWHANVVLPSHFPLQQLTKKKKKYKKAILTAGQINGTKTTCWNSFLELFNLNPESQIVIMTLSSHERQQHLLLQQFPRTCSCSCNKASDGLRKQNIRLKVCSLLPVSSWAWPKSFPNHNHGVSHVTMMTNVPWPYDSNSSYPHHDLSLNK